MLWYKSWLETRWRFVIGLVLLLFSAAGAVLTYPRVMELLPMAETMQTGGAIGRRIRESLALIHDYRGYIWSQWIREELCQLGTLFAVLLGTGGLLARRSALYTLSLPVSRGRLLALRAAAGLGELLILVTAPPLLICLLSPAVGEAYGIGDALAHALCAFVGVSVFFSLALLLSTVFGDVWRPTLIALGLAFAVAVAEELSRDALAYGLFRTLKGESFFLSGQLPWLGLLVLAALSAAMQLAAARNLARRDF